MCGPMGIGALWARRELLDVMPQFQAGSNMVHEVELESAPTRFAEGALKFEAGTPNVAGAVGLAAAVRFLESLGRKELWRREQELTEHVLSRLGKVKGVRILGPMKRASGYRCSRSWSKTANRWTLQLCSTVWELQYARATWHRYLR